MSPVLQFVGFKMLSDSEVVQQNLAVKRLRRTTVSPGERAHGFLYFEVPDGFDVEAARVRLAVRALGREGELPISLALNR